MYVHDNQTKAKSSTEETVLAIKDQLFELKWCWFGEHLNWHEIFTESYNSH